jgi:hypothetical protein
MRQWFAVSAKPRSKSRASMFLDRRGSEVSVAGARLGPSRAPAPAAGTDHGPG